MKKLTFLIGSLLFLGMGTSNAQYTVLHNFGNLDGSDPQNSVVYSSGILYGMAYIGGPSFGGFIYSYNTGTNIYTDLLNFNDTNGMYPQSSLLVSGNMLYGMVYQGGAHGDGCLFSFNTGSHTYTDLLDFDGTTNGANPYGSLIMSGTTLYGMTTGGGAHGDGTLFSFNTSGNTYTNLLNFDGTNGQAPYGSLVMSGTTLYGTASAGGAHGDGCLFSFNTTGNIYTDLFDFNVTDGQAPEGTLVLSGTTLYGTASGGGAHSDGCIFSFNTSGNNYTDLFDFSGTNGQTPESTLSLSGTTLYGTASMGGANGQGCAFSFNTNGNIYTDLHDFAFGPNGAFPAYSTVTIGGNHLYGTTFEGGANDSGVIYRLNDSLVASGVNSIVANSGSISVYPNPSNGQFTIQSSVVNGQSSVEVYNVIGEQVYSQSSIVHFPLSIDLSSQASGVYLYRVVSDNGNLLGQGKLIIQK